MPDDQKQVTRQTSGQQERGEIQAPSISLPKGGGAIHSIGEKFAANPVTGTGSMSVPIATSPGRSGFGPQLSLSYDSGAGNGLFGLGWNLSLPSISRKTDKGLPRYFDSEGSDVFTLAGAEDLVPTLDASGQRPLTKEYTVYGSPYLIRQYQPRVEGLFALIECWTEKSKPENMFWRVISRDNVTAWYGKSSDSRVMDPDNPAHIFQWFVCETHDDKGNVATYQYIRENAANVVTGSVEESNRNPTQRTANRYPDRIRYGNLKPYLPTLATAGANWPGPDDVADQEWMFEVVFDYSKPDSTQTPSAAPTDTSKWHVRADPFSSHRAGFEVRTYRLCQRVLMFHHFKELGTTAYLVRSTDFEYAEPADTKNPDQPGFTVLTSVTHRTYQKNPGAVEPYESRQLPPVAFTYSEPNVSSTVKTIAPDQLENLPVGTQGPGYQWIDLDGEGLSGVLSEQAGAWYYKSNLGDATFGPSRVVAPQPAMALAAGSRHQFMDLAGDGEIDVVDFAGPTPGFHERDRDEGWRRHVPFAFLPNINWNDPNLRFVDLTGDGHADALITEQEFFTWYPSLADDGFGAAECSRQPFDEDAGSHLVFADGTQTIFLADMCGDGLTDLVRIRNGEVCYWPNLGYGRFGRKVPLGNSPLFDHIDLYDPRRIRLADIDGSGPIDIIYLGRHGAQLYFNRSGNTLSEALTVDLPVATENLAAVQVADLLGNGTACLVWNSHLPADARNPVRYIDLMAGDEDPANHKKHEKPHLLIGVDNNLGGTTELEYTPSTRFYLQDRRNGTPWITRLPFPVHCVSKVTVRDKWRGTAFSSTYSYHHGYFDGPEREFRGFGRVEQVDVESFGNSAANNIASPFVTQDHTLYQPPVKTITWYHTGAALDRQRILSQFAHEYFPQRFADRLPNPAQLPDAFREKPLPDPELPVDLNADEWREALRACKGMVLRQEVYELDVDDLATQPPKHTPVRIFSAATHNCHIERRQARGDNQHAVFLVTESEALTYQYELALPKGGGAVEPDPRVAHTLNLRHDEQGNPQQSIAIGYGRWKPGDHGRLPRPDLINAVQSELHFAYSETRYTQDVVQPDRTPNTTQAIHHHRLRVPCEVKTYEISGLDEPAAGSYFDIAHLRRHELCEDNLYPPPVPINKRIPITKLEYHQQSQAAGPHRRIVEHARTLFFKDEDGITQPAAPHDFGEHGPRGLKYEDYKLALTDMLLDAVFTQRDAAGDVVDEKLKWPLEPAVGATPAVTARDKLDEPISPRSPYLKSGYILGTGIDPALTGQYWMRSGIAGFARDAHEHFYLPERYTDPFGNETKLEYDTRDLFIRSSTDARGNTASIDTFDYRVLAPREMVDPNGNRTESAFDIRGQVVAVAIKGKQINGQWQGDHLAGFGFDIANPSPEDVVAFCVATEADQTQATTWLGNSTTRFIYHFGDEGGQWAQRPAGTCAITREKHVGQLAAGEASDLQIALECTDGSGAVLMKKLQAEPELAGGPLRWIINGLSLLNNKGKPVKQYEPSFVVDFGYQLPQAFGESPTLYYDAAGRLMRTEFPDGTLSRVEFSPWHVKAFDPNDTIKESRWFRERLTAIERNEALFEPGASAQEQAQANAVEALAAAADAQDKRAARLAANHANTPALTILDSLGRDVIAIAHNRTPDDTGTWQDAFHLTYTRLDAEGKPLWIRDARGNLVMQYIAPAKPNSDPSDAMAVTAAPCYDIAGNLLYQHSMDAGDRGMLTDAAGKPMLAWDINERTLDDGSTRVERRLFHTRYDALHRPTQNWLRINDEPSVLIEAFEYLDAKTFRNAAGVINQAALDAAQHKNLLGQATRHHDPSGLATVERVDFKGTVEEVTRTLVKDVKAAIVDWNVPARASLLESDTFRQITEHDALGRMTMLYNWHRDITFQSSGTQQATPGSTNRVAVYVPAYNARAALQSEWLHVRATKSTDAQGHVSFTQNATRSQQAIKGITYNVKGQKLSLALGNGTTTRYTYDPKTFRLMNLRTRRDRVEICGTGTNSAFADGHIVQDLHYTYDPVGNITEIRDPAFKDVFFQNQRVEPINRYEYDALYRLVKASGRENGAASGAPTNIDPGPLANLFPCVADNAFRNYVQSFRYDRAGNIEQVSHQAGNGSWTRDYSYAFDDPAQPASNRLWQTSEGGATVTYHYDTHGNMQNLSNVTQAQYMRWDYRDMIANLDLGGGGKAYYNYDAGKQRTRKRIENQNGLGGYWERIYLGGYELYRRYKASSAEPVEEIESLHLFEGEQRVLLVDDVIIASNVSNPRPDGLTVPVQTLFRYQYSNHLGSACLELDDQADIISYEEYHPYGTSAYRAMKSGIEAPPKRYRYTGMERDEESGLSYHGARYLAPWLTRWLSADPQSPQEDANCYRYVRGNPTSLSDPNGMQAMPVTPAQMVLMQRLFDDSFSSSLLRQQKLPDEDLEPVIAMMPDGTFFASGRSAVERESRAISHDMAVTRAQQTMGNLVGGPIAAIGYGLGGDKGSDIGALGDLMLLMGSPHPLNTQQVVNSPNSGNLKPPPKEKNWNPTFIKHQTKQLKNLPKNDPVRKALLDPKTDKLRGTQRRLEDTVGFEAGHLDAKSSKHPQRLALQDADLNARAGETIESKDSKAKEKRYSVHEALEIRPGVHMEVGTAKQLVRLGVLPPEVLENATPSQGWVAPAAGTSAGPAALGPTGNKIGETSLGRDLDLDLGLKWIHPVRR